MKVSGQLHILATSLLETDSQYQFERRQSWPKNERKKERKMVPYNKRTMDELNYVSFSDI
jgi:hypothetical protein